MGKRTASGKRRRAWRGLKELLSGGVIGATLLLWGGLADASAETRSLDIYHMHTGEHETIVFKRDGVYDQQGLAELNHILRDWRRNETIKMDPALFDLIWEVYRESGATQPIQIVCGYRAPETNNMLRERTRGVAKFSQHTLGKAMDFFLPGVPLEKLREIGMRQQAGGVGFYPTSGSPFVHMDTGGVRAWPRMSREQLVRLFPDGKTLHLPADGGPPLPGYNLALADYQRKHSGQQVEVADTTRSGGKANPIAAFFGIKSGEDEGEDAAQPLPARTQVAQQTPAKTAAPPTLAANATRQIAPLPAPQPPRPVPTQPQLVASTQPHLAPKPIDDDVGPLRDTPEKPVVMASLPIPQARPMLQPATASAQQLAATPVSLTQPGSLIPLRQAPTAARAPGAIQPPGWSTGPSGVPTAEAIAALKAIDVPVPAAKPMAVIGAVPKPRPAIVTASLGTRPIDDAFSDLTGTPRDPGSSELLGYAPVAAPVGGTAGGADAHATTVALDSSARLRLASLGSSDVTASLPPPTQVAPGKQARVAPDAMAKGDRGDPMARLISHVTETLDGRFYDAGSSTRSPLVATFVHPDQDSVPQMIVKPTEVLAYNFGNAPSPLSNDRFAGPAVVPLAVIVTR